MYYISKKLISINDVFDQNSSSILVTIDDGFKNNYKVAFPILKNIKSHLLFFMYWIHGKKFNLD